MFKAHFIKNHNSNDEEYKLFFKENLKIFLLYKMKLIIK